MQIKISECMEGAVNAEGLTVIIDVFRAFSLECYMKAQGVERIIAVGEKEKAYELKQKYPEALLIGERDEKMLPGFDYGNSPAKIRGIDLSGKTVIHTTSAGTQGIVRAVHADEIITGALVNAKAIAEYIRKQNPKKVTLVGMGISGKKRAEEDWLCAQYIKELVQGKERDISQEIEALKKTSGARFFDPSLQKHGPKEDFYLCTKCNVFSFVLRAVQTEDGSEISCLF